MDANENDKIYTNFLLGVGTLTYTILPESNNGSIAETTDRLD